MRPTVLLVTGVAVACGAALVLRLPRLDLRPMHVDEAVHSYKFSILWQTGQYRYDLNEYHGPTLYYFTLPVVWLSGARDYTETTEAIYRTVAVAFGLGTILLVLMIAHGLGRQATVCAAWLTAVSPAMVFYNRYYIQESLLVFFTFLVIAAGWRYARSGHLLWAVVAGAGVGLMHATKETCVIALGCMALALGVSGLWSSAGAAPHRTGGHRSGRGVLAVGLALASAVLVSTVLFSGLLTNARGPLDSVRAFAQYFQRAAAGGAHVHPWYYYLRILIYWRAGAGPVWSEGLIVGLALVGIGAAVRGRPALSGQLPLLRFLSMYALLMTLSYSAIPYKTPWCILSALHAMTLVAGSGVIDLLRGLRYSLVRVAMCVLLLIGVGHLAWQAQRGSSLKFCTSSRNPYVYAPTLYAAADLAAQLDQLAACHAAGHSMLIKVMVENCWPLPWYLRRFTQVGYWETVPEEPDADVILVSSRLEDALRERVRRTYYVRHSALRPDERLLVFINEELWNRFVGRLRSASGADGQGLSR